MKSAIFIFLGSVLCGFGFGMIHTGLGIAWSGLLFLLLGYCEYLRQAMK